MNMRMDFRKLAGVGGEDHKIHNLDGNRRETIIR